jgi:hypothetical protein
MIENFMGERSKRVANIVGNVKVTVQGDELTLEGMDKEELGQTAANIHFATHVKKMIRGCSRTASMSLGGHDHGEQITKEPQEGPRSKGEGSKREAGLSAL